MPVSKKTLDGLPVFDKGNESNAGGLPIIKKKDGTEGTSVPPSTGSEGSAGATPSTSKPIQATPATNEEFDQGAFVLDKPVNASWLNINRDPNADPRVQKKFSEGNIVSMALSDPQYNGLTRSEQQAFVNQKLQENGLENTAYSAAQAAKESKKQEYSDLSSKDDGIGYSDFNQKKTVSYQGRNYEDSPIYHFNDKDYSLLLGRILVKYEGDQWVIASPEEQKQLENIGDQAQNKFTSVPQNITKNLFPGEQGKIYSSDVNNYLYYLRDNDPNAYNQIARRVLKNEGSADDLYTEQVKRDLLYKAENYKNADKKYDFDVLVDRLGKDNINKYNSLLSVVNSPDVSEERKQEAQSEINKSFSPLQLEDIQNLRQYWYNLDNSNKKLKEADNTVVKKAYQDFVDQQAYDAAAAISTSQAKVGPIPDVYSVMDAGKTAWNTLFQAANGVMQLPKRLDIDNNYGFLDRYSDNFNDAAKNLSFRTANRKLYDSKTGEFDTGALLPLTAQALTSMYLLGRGANALSGSVGYNAGIVASGFALQHNDYYEQALQNGLSDQQASAFATGAAALTAGLELVSPGEKIWGDNGLAQVSLADAMKRFQKGETIGSVLKPLGKELLNENLQEVSQDLGDIFSNGVANTILGDDKLNTQYKLSDFLETITATTLATGLAGGLKGVHTDNEEVLNKLTSKKSIYDIAINTIDANLDAGLITPQKALELNEQLTNRFNQKQSMPEDWNDLKKSKVADLQNEISSFEKNKYEVGPNGDIVEKPLTDGDAAAIQTIQDKISDISSKPNEYFDNELKTEQEKAQEVLNGNPTPVESILSEDNVPPNEKAAQIDELQQSLDEAKATAKERNFTGKDNNYLANKEPGFFSQEEREQYNELMKKPETEAQADQMVSDKKLQLKSQDEQTSQEGNGQEDHNQETDVTTEDQGDNSQEVLNAQATESAGADNNAPASLKPFFADRSENAEAKTKNIDTATEILKNNGVDASFSGYSDTNGVSVYFTDEQGRKYRISDHGVENKARMENEVLLRFDDKTLGINGKGIKDNQPSNKKEIDLLNTNQPASLTPNKDSYSAKIDILDTEIKHTDPSQLEPGDFIAIPSSPKSSGVTGFVKKIGRVNVTIETQYGGMGGNDSEPMELKVKKSDIATFYKPSQDNATKEGKVTEGDQSEHKDGDQGGETQSSGDSNSTEQRGEKPQEEKANVASTEGESSDGGSKPPKPPKKPRTEGENPPDGPKLLDQIRNFTGIRGEDVPKDNFNTYVGQLGDVDAEQVKEAFMQQLSLKEMTNLVNKFVLQGGDINDLAKLFGEDLKGVTKSLLDQAIRENVAMGVIRKSVGDAIFTRYSSKYRSEVSEALVALRASTDGNTFSPFQQSFLYSAIGPDFEKKLSQLNKILDQISNGVVQSDGSVKLLNDDELVLSEKTIADLKEQVADLKKKLSEIKTSKVEPVDKKRQKTAGAKLETIKQSLIAKYGENYMKELTEKIDKVSKKC